MLFHLFALTPFFTACDHIDESEQLIKVDEPQETVPDTTDPTNPTPDNPTSTVKHVLLEDFTGQKCINCPKGTETIEKMTDAYSDRLIAVGIHCGPLGFKGSSTMTGLSTELGDSYYDHWNLEFQPVGMIDRGTPCNYTEWQATVREHLALTSTIKMQVEARLQGNNISISVTDSAYADYRGKLQVWLLEDGIVAIQSMPDGQNNREYVHNHVLRTAVNGAWGEDLTLANGEEKTHTLTQAVDAAWNTDNLSVVAFIYNDNGVEQAAKGKVEK